MRKNTHKAITFISTAKNLIHVLSSKPNFGIMFMNHDGTRPSLLRLITWLTQHSKPFWSSCSNIFGHKINIEHRPRIHLFLFFFFLESFVKTCKYVRPIDEYKNVNIELVYTTLCLGSQYVERFRIFFFCYSWDCIWFWVLRKSSFFCLFFFLWVEFF